MSFWADPVYALVRRLIGLALGFYFARIERFHEDRVPRSGPVLFTSNHPNSLGDSFVIGASVPRKVYFVATVQLFRIAPLRWFLTRCGVIPINRVKDDPREMRSVAQTFEACFRVLERGEAVGIFPEGITYEDSQLKEVKTGAARMALEFEERHKGDAVGLRILPAGLSYSAKERYRGSVLVHFGEPIRVADFASEYSTQRKECIRRLTAELDHRLRGLIVDIPALEQTRVVEGVRRLYLDRLLVGNTVIHEPVAPKAEDLLLTQAITEAVSHVFRNQPARAAVFARKLANYEGWLARLRISDAALARPERSAWPSIVLGGIALLGLPLALYGWIHRLLPYVIIRYVQARFVEPGKKKAQAATAAIVAGIVGFGFFYPCYVLLFHLCFGWPATLWYAVTLPLVSLFAHYYITQWAALEQSLRDLIVLGRAPVLARRLGRRRADLIAEIEAVRSELRLEEAKGKPGRAIPT
jgi:glycerol-3-phosphate O-acyltransferase/dihydroxyacetone phosphate acyltransferase